MNDPDLRSTPITVLGLGAMGSAIAKVLLENGHPLTVWNRTASKTAPLARAGAAVADEAADAVAASSLAILCVLDYEAVDNVLDLIGDAISGKTLINVTSGSPARARQIQARVESHGARYFDGGVKGDPPAVGTSHVTFPFSGSRDAYDASESVLRELGTPTFHGEDAGLASVEFMAQVAVAYELLIGFLHALDLVRREGVDPADFAARVAGSIDAYPGLLRMIGEAVRDGTYPPDLGPLSVQVALMDDLLDHRDSHGVDNVRMREVRDRMSERVADGHGDQGFSSLIETFTTR